jgi:hypothetical protein
VSALECRTFWPRDIGGARDSSPWMRYRITISPVGGGAIDGLDQGRAMRGRGDRCGGLKEKGGVTLAGSIRWVP